MRRLKAEYQRHLEDLNESGGSTAEERRLERQLRLRVLAHKRREVTRLRDSREIDDLVLRSSRPRWTTRRSGCWGAGPTSDRRVGTTGAAQSTW